jgi:hypothetical protein
MTIGEALSVDQVIELVRKAEQMAPGDLPGFISREVLVEDGGRMVVIADKFENRPMLIKFHTSAEYRRFVAATQHLLVGNFVLKVFELPVVVGYMKPVGD